MQKSHLGSVIPVQAGRYSAAVIVPSAACVLVRHVAGLVHLLPEFRRILEAGGEPLLAVAVLGDQPRVGEADLPLVIAALPDDVARPHGQAARGPSSWAWVSGYLTRTSWSSS